MGAAEVPSAARIRAAAQSHAAGTGAMRAGWAMVEGPRAEREGDTCVVLRWSPTVPLPRTPFGASAVRPGGRGMPLPTLLCVDRHRGIPRGASAYLLLTGWTPGLVARGRVLCAPFLAARLDRPGTVGQHVMVEWTQVLGLGGRIPLEILQAEMPDVGWLPGEASAVPLASEPSELVRRLWREWIDGEPAGSRSIVGSDLMGRE